jgi:aldose 1-epimerase
MTVEIWGETPEGLPVERVTLSEAHGIVAKLTNLGATLTELWIPDRNGEAGNVVLGFEEVGGYLHEHPYLGSTVGRVGNRIGGARFELDGVEYRLSANDGTNHLHGGAKGFHAHLWDMEPNGDHAVMFRLHSPDGDEGYPGNLETTVRYTLEDDGLRIDYQATTDAPTPVNLTNHSYFNLAGSGTIVDHIAEIAADHDTPTDDEMIPTGEIAPVIGTGIDFTSPTRIGDRIDQYLSHANGYDHNFVLRSRGGVLAFAARVTEPASGRVLEVWTTEPAMQLYTGNWLDGTLTGIGGVTYPTYGGLCLETQHYPDSVNHPQFPSTILRPGDTLRSTTVYRFGVEAA